MGFMNLRRFLSLFFSILFFWISTGEAGKKKIILKVFHAGSLSVPFAAIEKAFEARYPWIDVRRESSGSVQAIRKVTELGKPCDVVASADYTLIPKMMFPRYADHVYLFARNELVLAYTPRSRYASEINSENWFEILARPKVRWGFSNPNLDPCGYRTVIALFLAEKFYGKPLYDLLLRPHLPFKVHRGKRVLVEIPLSLRPRGGKIFLRPKAVELLGLLESGTLDYAFEYLSVARQHGLRYLRLPEDLNLSRPEKADFYRQVAVKLATGKIIPGKAIVYGLTVVKNAPHLEEARLFESFVIGPEGARILKANFQTPLQPARKLEASAGGP